MIITYNEREVIVTKDEGRAQILFVKRVYVLINLMATRFIYAKDKIVTLVKDGHKICIC